MALDVKYKAQYELNLELQAKNASGELKAVNSEVDKLSKDLNKARGHLESIRKSFSILKSDSTSMNAIGKLANEFKKGEKSLKQITKEIKQSTGINVSEAHVKKALTLQIKLKNQQEKLEADLAKKVETLNRKVAENQYRQQTRLLKQQEREQARVARKVEAINRKAAEYEFKERTKFLTALERRKLKAAEYEFKIRSKMARDLKSQEDRITDSYYRNRKKAMNLIMAQFKADSREKQAIELRRIRSLSDTELRAEARRVARRRAGGRTNDTAFGARGLLDSTYVVAKYGAISQVLYGIQNTFGAIASEIVKFDNRLYQNIAVLGVNKSQAKELTDTVVQLGKSYGGTFDEIQEGLITLGRAGVGDGNVPALQAATKVIKEMAMITGDDMSTGAEIMSSMINVFKLGAPEIQEVGNQMMYVANATRLNLEDFSTFSNYALVTAESLGLTKESTLGLAGAMSKVGVNASTIGTNIRRLQKLIQDDSEANVEFFRIMGISQEEFAKDLRTDSDKAIRDFSKHLADVSKDTDRYSKAVGGLDTLMKQTIEVLRAIGKQDFFGTMIDDMKGGLATTDEQAGKMAMSIGAAFERVKNTVISTGQEIGTEWFDKYFDRENVEEFNKQIEELGETIKGLIPSMDAIVNIGLAYVFYNTAKSVAAVTIEVGSLTAALRVLALANLPAMIGATAVGVGLFAKEAISYHYKTQDGGYEDDKQRADTIEKTNQLIANQKESFTELNGAIDESNKTIDAYSKQIKLLENQKGGEAAIKLLKDKIEVEKQAIAEGNKVLASMGNTNDLTDVLGTQVDIIKEFNEEGSKYQGRLESNYELTTKDIQLKEESLGMQRILSGEVTKEGLAREKINNELSAAKNKMDALKNAGDEQGFIKAENEYLNLRMRAKAQELQGASKSADQADRELKARFSILSIEAKLAVQRLLTADAETARIRTNYELNMDNLRIAEAETKEKREALAEAKELYAKSDSKSRGQAFKQVKQMELDLEKAKTNEAKLRNKEAIDTAMEIKKILSTGLTSFLKGDFARGMQDLIQGFADKGANALSDTLGTGLTNMITGAGSFSDLTSSLSSLSTGDWIGATIGLIGGLLSDTMTQAEIDAAKGRVEFDDNSLRNLGSIFESAQYPLLEVTNKMHKHIRNMDENFFAVARAFSTKASSGGIDLTGANFADRYEEGFLGFSSKSVSLLSTGLAFSLSTLGKMMNEATLGVKAYTTTLVQESSWFGLSNDTSIKKSFKNLPESVRQDIADSFANGYEAILTAGVSLGLNEVNLEEALRASKIDIGEVDFTGLSPSEVSDRLSQVFSEALSGVVSGIADFSVLVDRYAKGSEYSLETLIRISTEYDQASHMFGLIGKTFTNGVMDVTRTWTEETIVQTNSLFGGLLGTWTNWLGTSSNTIGSGLTGWVTNFWRATQTITQTFTETTQEIYTAQMQILDIVESAGGLQSFQDAMGTYMSNFFTDEEQLQFMIKSLDTQFATLGLTAPKTNAEFRRLLETMDTSTQEGAYLYGQVLLLAEGFSQMTNAADSLRDSVTSIQDAISQIADAWLGSLSYLTAQQKTMFAEGYYALATSSPSGLDTVEAARLAAETAMKTTATKEDYIPVFNRYITELENQAPEATLDDVVGELRILITRVEELEETTRMTI